MSGNPRGPGHGVYTQLFHTQKNAETTRMAFSRAHTYVKAADGATLLHLG